MGGGGSAGSSSEATGGSTGGGTLTTDGTTSTTGPNTTGGDSSASTSQATSDNDTTPGGSATSSTPGVTSSATASTGGAPPIIEAVSAGSNFTCVLLSEGRVRCWGSNTSGQLGYGHLDNIGDNETPDGLSDVDVGGKVIQLSCGAVHSCALLEGGKVRCWGSAEDGRLGYGNTSDVGDNEAPALAGDVDVGGAVSQIAAGNFHTCALLVDGTVRCWGSWGSGRLGFIATENIGDNESPADGQAAALGGSANAITTDWHHTCAMMANGGIRCWGLNNDGGLGYGTTEAVGDDETPASMGDVDVGVAVDQLLVASSRTCIVTAAGGVRCWGRNYLGALGYANLEDIGDNELPSTLDDVMIGGTVESIAGGGFTCALLTNGAVRCWGGGLFGRLGYGNTEDIGDNEHPATAGNVNVGGTVVQLAVGGSHACVVLTTGALRCWGKAENGQLGYGNTNDIGDNEDPASAGDVPL